MYCLFLDLPAHFQADNGKRVEIAEGITSELFDDLYWKWNRHFCG